MLHQTLGVIIVLLFAGCSTPSPYQNVPPECQGNTTLSVVSGGKLGRADEAACRAAIMQQGGPMGLMKSPEQIMQERGIQRPQRQQQDMPPMTPEQLQQTQQMMQQMQPMMHQRQPGMMPPGMTQPGMTPQGQTPTSQPGMVPPGMPQMTPQQQEQLRQQMQQPQAPQPTQ